jgi:hypothetical protein
MLERYVSAAAWRRLGFLLGLAALALTLAYTSGWRLPGLDRHPSWDEFPHLTNPRLIVEEIPDFDARYGRRYQLPAAVVEESRPVNAYWFEAYYRTNLKSVRRLGYRRTGNTFDWGGWGLSFGGNERGPAQGVTGPHFRPDGYEYLELTLAEQSGYFKGEVYENNRYLPYFYQYNYPAAPTDTLFLRHASSDYRVFVR